MDDRQNARLQRGIRVVGVLITFLTTWTANVVITAIKLAIVNSIARIQALASVQSTSITGNTRNKLMNCILMATPGAVYAGILLDWAIATGNGILAGEIAFSFTDLSKGSAEDITNRNELVRDRLVTNMTALIAAGYPVTLVMATAYSGLITNYTDDVPLWKEASSTIKTATGQLALELNNLTITLFDSLKRNLLIYKVPTTMTFWSTVINAMRTVTTGTRRIYLRVKFIDSVTGMPITGVTCTLILDTVEYIKLCSARGYSSFMSLSNGNGWITCVKNGYGTVVVRNLSIRDLFCLKITVEMIMSPSAVAAKAAKDAKETTEVAEDVVVEGGVVDEIQGKKRKAVVKKMVMPNNPAVVKSEVVPHKIKGK